jgi:FMN phosphatase YigB (HAD superfamily)
MTLTLLVDLDDTLLGNQMESFIPAYLGALGQYLSDRVAPEKMVATMLAATGQMAANKDPRKTLKQVFDPNFYPPLGLDEVEMRAPLKEFYAHHFPTIQGVTQFRPAAPEFIQAAVRRGYQVGIATNPLFPLTAINQRLTWAGLPPEANGFCLVPSYETFHFAKPNPAYFAEFLGRIGWPDGPILMVGNDGDHDIRGSRGMGLPVFWVSQPEETLPEGIPDPSGCGSLAQVLPWLDSQPPPALLPDFNTVSAMLATLRGSPAALAHLLQGQSQGTWLQRPDPSEWSLTEIACHLRDVEREVNLPRLVKLTHEDNPFISGVDSDTWAVQRDYQSQDGPAALADYMDTRCETLDLLDRLEPEQWDLPCRHAIFGPTGLKEIVQFSAAHERLHSRQVYETLNHPQRAN